jgi:hypothetical protein
MDFATSSCTRHLRMLLQTKFLCDDVDGGGQFFTAPLLLSYMSWASSYGCHPARFTLLAWHLRSGDPLPTCRIRFDIDIVDTRLPTLSGAGLILTGQLMLILDALIRATSFDIIILNGGAISWKSRQDCVSLLPLKPNTLLQCGQEVSGLLSELNLGRP